MHICASVSLGILETRWIIPFVSHLLQYPTLKQQNFIRNKQKCICVCVYVRIKFIFKFYKEKILLRNNKRSAYKVLTNDKYKYNTWKLTETHTYYRVLMLIHISYMYLDTYVYIICKDVYKYVR